MSQFKYDLFISYAHVDNEPLNEEEKLGWVSKFSNSLERLLARKLGRHEMVRIWRDSKALRGNTRYDPEIEDAISNSAVFLCVLSKAYLASEYCLKELATFSSRA